ncbi:SDR family oxidoreductase [Breoghania sp. L-A4]|uniref:SDR family NAD(P)-dependent oxidoreductase n=1 Tax=Breoghania sp. L-A4 TaxID=2304600 RepID=UPI000E35CAFA|nr:SDR family oxidoreductase [Breoghania sp. L-A4]AXS39219.1 SDR family oxidoreductase [Breoghania sp. L-A4]
MTPGAIYSSLKDRTVLVTGGGSGIGESIVEHFIAQGAKVGFIDIAEEASKALVDKIRAEGGTVHFEQCDLKDIPATQAAIGRIREALGPITILVNNAAHDQRHAIDEVTPEYWDDRIAVNLKHQFFCAQAVAPDMKAAGRGAIINMGSVSWMIGQGNMPGYTTSKSAVVGLTRALARDLGEFGIRVVSVAPGWIMTERQIELWLDEEGEKELMTRQCLKRKLVPADIAKSVLFFASDEAGACTNQTYVVDGGWV